VELYRLDIFVGIKGDYIIWYHFGEDLFISVFVKFQTKLEFVIRNFGSFVKI